MWFLIFILIAHQPFLFATDTLQRCPLPFWLYGFNLHSSLSMCRIFSLFYYSSHNKHSLIHSTVYLSLSLPLNDNTLGLFLPIFYSMHQAALADLQPTLGRDAFLAEHISKEVLVRYRK